MTVLNTQTTATYYGNGTTTTFPFSFLIPSGKLVVSLTTNGYSSVVNSGYTVNGYDNPAGGSVVFYTAPASGTLITLERRLDLLQQLELTTGGAFYAEVVEDALDKSAMVDLQQQALLDRSIKGPSYEYPHNVTLPAADLRANKVLAFDSNGGVRVSSFSLSQIEAGATTEKSAQDAINAATEADTVRTEVLAAKADFDPKYTDFAGKYADFAPKYALFAPGYSDFAAKYSDFAPKYTIAQSQWPTVQMAEKWADQDEDVEVISGSGKFSAKHWAQKTANIIAGGTSVISAGDSVPDFLGNKLLPGNGISFAVAQAGPSQTMTITNSAVPKFSTKTSAALAQNASLVIPTPNVKDGDGLKRVVSVFEETIGSSVSDTATDFDMADAAQFTLRDYAPSTAVTLVGNEQTSPVALLSSDSSNHNSIISAPLNDDGSRAVIVSYDPVSAVTKAYVVTRLGPGSYSVGVPVTLTSGQIYSANLLRMNATTVVLTYRGTSGTPYIYYARVITVDGGGAIALGAVQVLRNSGYTYGTLVASCCRISDTEFCAAVIDIIPNGGNQYVNYARVTLSGTAVTVGAWNNIFTTLNGLGGVEVSAVSPSVVAVMWSEASGSWYIRLLDVATNPYTLGGAALQATSISYNHRIFGVVSLSDTQFAVLSGGDNVSSYSMYGRVYSHVGTATPAYVSSISFMSGVGAWWLTAQRAIVQTGVNKYRVHALSMMSPYNKVYYIDFSLSPSNTLSVDATQSITIAGTYYGSYPSTFIQAVDGYVWTLAPRTSDYAYVAFEYRPSLSATLGSGSWAASDVGRAVVAANGVAKVASVNGATAELTTLDAFDTSGTFTAGQWKLQDAALYNGYVYNIKGNLAVVRTVKDSSLWEALTATSASAPGGSLMAWSFDKGHSWAVWINSAKRVIATDKATLHGGIEGQWMVQNGTGSWIFPPEDSAQSALESAFAIPENQTLPTVYTSLGATSFAALGFVKSMSGTVELAFALPTAASSVNQFTLTYTSRSAWKRADSSYSIDYGREDQVTITKTSSGTASTFATVMTVEQA